MNAVTSDPDDAIRSQRIDDMFRSCARRYGDRVALSSASCNLTYRELDILSDRFALKLKAAGLGIGEYVAFSLMHREDAVIAMLAILKAGCAYVPLDRHDGADQAERIMRAANVRVLVSAAPRSGLAGVTVVQPCDRDATAVSDCSTALPTPETAAPDAIACLMFTSGTTAGPKGVMVPHRGIIRLVHRPHYIDLGPDTVMAQIAPMTFDASTFEIWGALLSGGRLVIYSSAAFDAERLDELIRAHSINTIWLTAGLFHTLARHRINLFKSIRTVLTGGDVVRPESVRRVLEICPGITIVNGYGPTENTTFTACHAMTSAAEIGERVPIGKPVAGTTVHILDTNMRPVACGEEGELFCGGLGVASGYLGEPELTARRFLAAPWDPREILYRTGDRARALPDGTLMFLGRTDDQVKVRGHRVMLGEIRDALLSIDCIEEAIVDFVSNENGNRLVAHVQINALDAPGPRRIKALLQSLLPPYAVPDLIRVTPELELTQNGKVRRTSDSIKLQPRATPHKNVRGDDHDRC